MEVDNMKTANVYARIEPNVKEKAEEILNKIGIPASVAINMYYKQIIVSNGIPFKVVAEMPKNINLDLITKEEFNDEMNDRYQEALIEDGIEVNKFFNDFRKRQER